MTRLVFPAAIIGSIFLCFLFARSLRTTMTLASQISASIHTLEDQAFMQKFTITNPSGSETVVFRPPGMATAAFLEMVQGIGEFEPKEATWMSGGNTYMVLTPRLAGETIADWCDRHDDLVDAAKMIFPPD